LLPCATNEPLARADLATRIDMAYHYYALKLVTKRQAERIVQKMVYFASIHASEPVSLTA
jgi:hypothetical protein